MSPNAFLSRPSALLLTLSLSGASCNSEDKSSDDDETVSCRFDPRVDNYVPNLDRMGDLGLLSFRLLDSDPAPPAKGNNTFHVQIRDAQGAPASAQLGIDLKMPDHGHGTPVKPQITLDPASASFTVTPVYLFMGGVWRVELQAYADGAPSAASASNAVPLDRAGFFFCVEG